MPVCQIAMIHFLPPMLLWRYVLKMLDRFFVGSHFLLSGEPMATKFVEPVLVHFGPRLLVRDWGAVIGLHRSPLLHDGLPGSCHFLS